MWSEFHSHALRGEWEVLWCALYSQARESGSQTNTFSHAENTALTKLQAMCKSQADYSRPVVDDYI